VGHGRARPWRVVGHCSSTYSSQSVSDQIPILFYPTRCFLSRRHNRTPAHSPKRIPPILWLLHSLSQGSPGLSLFQLTPIDSNLNSNLSFKATPSNTEGPLLPFVPAACLSAPRHLQWTQLITQIHLPIHSLLCTQTTITVRQHPFWPQTLRPTAPLSLVPGVCHPILENYSLMPPSRCPQYSSSVHCYWGAPYG
jgi:hypothetical protein